jgi:murein DD-endopeptidase MepM/ murein hydrolase activator NlpD
VFVRTGPFLYNLAVMEDRLGTPTEEDVLLPPMWKENLLEKAQLAILSGDEQLGRRLLVQLLEQDPRNETAWLWLSSVVTSASEHRACLQRVLRINPQNQVAADRLQRLDRRAIAQRRISQQRARVKRVQNMVIGVTLILALFLTGLASQLGIGERLAEQSIALVPLYTPVAVAVRPPTFVPIPTTMATLLPTVPTSMPEPVDTVPSETPTSPEEDVGGEAGVRTEAEGMDAATIESGDVTESQSRALAFAMPVSGDVSVGFSRVHPALDFDAPVGTTVFATASGRVVFAGWNPRGSGNLVVISHAGGWESWYAHLDGISVRLGDWVCHACPIGTVGSTGFSSGPHLHFEIRQGCSFYNLSSGERLSSGVAANYRYDPFGAPICLVADATPTPPGGLAPDGSSSAGDSIETEGEKGLDELNLFPP